MTERRMARATASGVAAIVLWSSLALLTTLTEAIPPFELLGLSFVLGGLVLLAWNRARGEHPVPAQPPAAWALTIGALFGYHALYFVALKRAPAVEANLLNYLWPLLIVVFASLLPGMRVRGAQLAGACLGLVAAGLLVTRGRGLAITTEHVPGYLAAVGAALTWSGYSVANRRFGDLPSGGLGLSCLVVGVLGLAVHGVAEVWVDPGLAGWGVLVAMGLGPVGAAFFLWDAGTKRGDLGLLGTLSYAAPILSTGLLLAFGRATLHWTQGAACLLLLLGAGLGLRSAPGPRATSGASR